MEPTTNVGNGRPRVTLADPQIRTAVKALESTFALYSAKGGVKELETKLEERKGSLAKGIYDLAMTASRLGQSDPGLSKDYFGLMCQSAEKAFKEKHSIENVKDLCPPWPVFKSEIARAMKEGIRILEFPTYGAMKAARTEQTRQAAEKARGARPEGNANRPAVASGDTATDTLKASGIYTTEKLKAVFIILAQLAPKLDASQQDALADKLSKVIAAESKKIHAAGPAAKADDEAVPQGAEKVA